jgi:hypothetical protein
MGPFLGRCLVSPSRKLPVGRKGRNQGRVKEKGSIAGVRDGAFILWRGSLVGLGREKYRAGNSALRLSSCPFLKTRAILQSEDQLLWGVTSKGSKTPGATLSKVGASPTTVF